MKDSKYIIGSLLWIIIILVVYNDLPYSDYGMRIMGMLGIVQLLYSIYSWSKITNSVIAPYIIFLVSAYIFTFGQSMLYVFDKVSPERDLTKIFSAASIMPAQYLTLIFLIFFHIGGILSCRKKKAFGDGALGLISSLEDNIRLNQINGIRAVGKLFLCISAIPYLIERFTIFFVVLSYGYTGIYMQEEKIGIFNMINILSQYFIPGVLCMLLVENSKNKRYFFIALLIIEACFWLFTGGRSNGAIIVSILLMYYHICIKSIRLKQSIVVAVIGFFFVALLGVISENRSESNVSFSKSLSESFNNSNAFYSAISEMGGSMYPMITTMELVPNRYDYKYGTSYLYAATSVIPNLGFWDLHPAMKYGNMNDWLQKAMDLNYGPGFSIVAEAYINFGNYGFLVMLLMGYLFGLIFNIDIRDKRNPLLIVLSFVFCYLVIKTVRNSFLATARSIFYYIIPIYLIVVYMYRGRLNSRIRK